MENRTPVAPVACSLSDAALRERRAFAREILLPYVTDWQRTAKGLTVHFSKGENLRGDLEMFVRLESQCCGFLHLTVTPAVGHLNAPLTLQIDGPVEAAATIDMFARALCGES